MSNPKTPTRKAGTRKSPVVNLNQKRAEKKGRRTSKAAQKPAAEKPAVELGPPVKLRVFTSDLRPFLAIAPTKEARTFLNGVHLCKDGDVLRLAATDGHRLLVQAIPHTDPLPWAEGEGVILPADRLGRIAKFIGNVDEPLELTYGEHWKALTLACADAVFDVTPIDATFPDYKRILNDVGDVFSAEREPLETSAINPKYLRQAGQVGALYGAEGVFCFTGNGEGAMAFTFMGVKGVILVQMGVRTDDKPGLEGSVAKLIGERGMTGTLAALKAHETRNRQAAGKAKNEAERDRLTAAADRFAARIAEIMAGLAPQLEHKSDDATPASARIH